MQKPLVIVDYDDIPLPEPDPAKIAATGPISTPDRPESSQIRERVPSGPVQQSALESLLSVAIRADAAYKSASESLVELTQRIEQARLAKTAAWIAYADAFKAYQNPKAE